MAYERGSFGIEYRPEGPSEETPWLLWAIGIAVAVALVYGSIAGYRRFIRWLEEKPEVTTRQPVTETNEVVTLVTSTPDLTVHGKRSRQVDNLLMRYDRAIAMTNVALLVSTIEQIRSLPGAPLADRDDELARQLGPLKLRMLFDPAMRNEWVKTIEVKRGNSASRIAAEYGTTVKCLEKLNGSVASLKAGQPLKVMNHPQFQLSVYRKTGLADLFLNGRFFKRYYLLGDVSGEDGSYVFPSNTRAFLAEKGIKLVVKDVSELEMLLPKGATMTIADFR